MDPDTLLYRNGLSRTRNRVNILNALKESERPLSGKEIRLRMTQKCDISTVYRTLNSLYKKKLLQRVIIDYEVKFALNAAHHPGKRNRGDHIHFKCNICDRLFCLTEIEVKDYTLPVGFEKEENQFLVIGKCRECQY